MYFHIFVVALELYMDFCWYFTIFYRFISEGNWRTWENLWL